LVTFPSNDEARIRTVRTLLFTGKSRTEKNRRVPARDVGLSGPPGQSIHGRGLWRTVLRDAEDVGSALNALKNLNF
ncbi:HK97 family phage prohead protease, partial [Escherichia coli]|nr:HK97 family phage prohead protease [Escherichia coli]